jgi:hypothetical protein
MEIGKLKDAKEDVTALFFITQQRILNKDECRAKLNEIRKELGCPREISEEEFERDFTSKAPAQGAPAPEVKHDGNYHTVDVDVKKGEEQKIEAKQQRR